MVIEREFLNKDPREIAKKTFCKNFHYRSNDLFKTQQFYELILIDIDFVKNNHHPYKFDNSKFGYSTCHVLKILTISQWGPNSNTLREFSQPYKPRFYNY